MTGTFLMLVIFNNYALRSSSASFVDSVMGKQAFPRH